MNLAAHVQLGCNIYGALSSSNVRLDDGFFVALGMCVVGERWHNSQIWEVVCNRQGLCTLEVIWWNNNPFIVYIKLLLINQLCSYIICIYIYSYTLYMYT